MANTAIDLKKYFSTPEKPVSAGEMMDFWKSLSESDREYFKNVDLTTGLLPA